MARPTSRPNTSEPADTIDEARYRSGAVARMVRMPVATLRIWERRYQVSAPALTPTGQRLYSAADGVPSSGPIGRPNNGRRVANFVSIAERLMTQNSVVATLSRAP